MKKIEKLLTKRGEQTLKNTETCKSVQGEQISFRYALHTTWYEARNKTVYEDIISSYTIGKGQ